MSNLSKMFNSSIGRKLIMALTGLFLCSFLVVHLSGNLSLFFNDEGEAFNKYTHFMSTNMFLRVIEIGLLLGFVFHIATAFKLTNQNASSRKIKYDNQKLNETSNWFSRNMGLSGSVVLIFLIMHLVGFWGKFHFQTEPSVMYDGEPSKDMYTIVVEAFQVWWIVLVYVIGVILLGFHLNHGFQSAFQSLGLKSKAYASLISNVGTGFAVIMTVGFASFPIMFFTGILEKIQAMLN